MIVNPGFVKNYGLAVAPSPVGLVTNGVAGGATLSFLRAQTTAAAGPPLSTATAADGVTLNTYLANIPRQTGPTRRLLLESTRTNIVLNSAILVTQIVTVVASIHALSFYGTGTVTLTGASTAGPLVGTGINNRVSLIFTPTAGALTLTVAGSVLNAQLENVGNAQVPSSYIPTTTHSTVRDIDYVTWNPYELGIPANGSGTYFWAGTFPHVINFAVVVLDDGTAAVSLRFEVGAGAGGLLRIASTSTNTVPNLLSNQAVPVAGGAYYRVAYAFDGGTGRLAGSVNGGAAVSGTGIGPFNLGPTPVLRLGRGFTGFPAQECAQFQVLPGVVLSDAELAAATASMAVTIIEPGRIDAGGSFTRAQVGVVATGAEEV